MRLFLVGLIVGSSILLTNAFAAPSPLEGKKICIDPGHGGTAATDHYRVGLKGEREEWINLRVALLLKKMLEKKGAEVMLTRTGDQSVSLAERADMAVKNKADVFISIHHNATADRNVNFPIIYYHGAASENLAGVQLGKHLAGAFREYFYKEKVEVSLVSDHCVFPSKGAAVLRETYGIPGLLAEASFFTNEKEEQRLRRKKHNRNEARAYIEALELFFEEAMLPVKEKKIPLTLPPFEVFQEADRMKPEALMWKENYEKAQLLEHTMNPDSLLASYNLLTLSARSFPDSYVARDCHIRRAWILKKLNRHEEAGIEKKRYEEFYVNLEL